MHIFDFYFLQFSYINRIIEKGKIQFFLLNKINKLNKLI